VHGHVGEARRWLESILAIPGPSTATLRANVLHAAGVLAASQADHAFARSMAEASLQVRREVGDREGAARSLGNLGVIAELQGQLGEARRLDATVERAMGDDPRALRRRIADL